MPWTIRIALLVAAVLLCVSAIGLWATRAQEPTEWPTQLRVGILPDAPEAQLTKRFAPLLRHLERRMRMPCRLVISASYDDLVERFGRGELEVAWFGAVTFLRAQEAHGALPIAMRDVDVRMTSVFLVRSEDADLALADFEGRRLALGNPNSTSGSLIPRAFLEQKEQLRADEAFQVVQLPTHEAAALSVRDGTADLAAVNGVIVEQMFAAGDLPREGVEILRRTPPFVDRVWAARRGLGASARAAFREALLELDTATKEHARILEPHHCGGFLPASPGEFESVRRLVAAASALEQG